MTPAPLRVVAAALVDDLDRPTRLLAARRVEPPRWAGQWELPGGKVEPGEEPEAALHRELFEELGIVVRLGIEVRAPGGGDWPLGEVGTFRLWLAQAVDGAPTALEDHDEIRWLAAHELDDVGWLEADVPAVEALRPLIGLVIGPAPAAAEYGQ